MATFFQEVIDGFRLMTWQEATGVIFGIISVFCSRANSIWVYPTGLISTGIYTFLFAQPAVGLYAEAGLNAYYFIMSVYGWYNWTRQRNGTSVVEISWMNRRDWQIAIGIVAVGWLFIWFVLKTYTDSTVPVLDALVSATAWSGMWLLAKRKIENWLMLNVSNFIAVPLLLYKGLAPTAVLTVILFIVAVNGYFHWRRIYREQLNEPV
ncbi:nicotinamide riboside transporter PnuC [Chitinophaga deserti]|uniref:nicotinamide riboside transporter PnuC n=1 Tax=Chitinophaga deserti TaxID=2164099 RepID=UPI000D6D8F6A|nr:nicotinamide riboside transporter PnuC [Chitinophaga deserti]